MLKISNITELNDTVSNGFKLSYCQYLDGSNIEREPHYQIQFDKCPPQGSAQPACLTIGVNSDSRGRYFCKLVYGTTDNVIWQEWLSRVSLKQKDALLEAIASLLHKHINRI